MILPNKEYVLNKDPISKKEENVVYKQLIMSGDIKSMMKWQEINKLSTKIPARKNLKQSIMMKKFNCKENSNNFSYDVYLF